MNTFDTWQCGSVRYELESRVLVMGILNVTPDSFSDGGEHNTLEAAVAWAQAMHDAGADIIDVGGESTRPGFDENAVTLDEERRRVLPVVDALVKRGMIVSVDTSKPEIMREAAAAGAAVLNDIRGFELPGALEAAAATDCGLVVMHRTRIVGATDPLGEVVRYLEARTNALLSAGVARERIVWDPGCGFGKTADQTWWLLAQTAALRERARRPVMTAVSRKGSIGKLLARETKPEERDAASTAAALFAARHGARILRVHDVGSMADALRVWQALESEEREAERA